MKTVLVVDDEKLIRWSLCEALRKDFLVMTEESAEAALNLLGRVSVDAVLTDLKLPGMSGIDLVGILRNRHPDLPVFVVSAYVSRSILDLLAVLGVRKVFSKPFETGEVREALIRSLGHGPEVIAPAGP